jgi:deoxyribonuclease-4
MFGPHVERLWTSGDITKNIETARLYGQEVGITLKAFQIFVAGPRNRNFVLDSIEANILKNYITDIWVVAHGTYADAPWTGNAYAAKFIRDEIALCAISNISGLVVHLGSQPPDEVITYLPRLITSQNKVRLFLEIPHVLPINSYYETPEKLDVLFTKIRNRIDPHLHYIGLCVDTAHLWSCGVDISSFEAAELWLRTLESVIPPHITMFHLNDSFNDCGAGVDHHAPLLQGKIWKNYASNPHKSGLAAFVDYIIRHNLPAILERKDPDPKIKDPRAVLESDYITLLELNPQLN